MILIAAALGLTTPIGMAVAQRTPAPTPGEAATPPPRQVVVPDGIPDVPTRMPDRVAVMAFENRAGVRALDWMVAGVPLELGEKVEESLPLAPTWGPLVVPEGPVVPASADAVAAFAARTHARWVFTGWVERPNWDLRLAVVLWRVDADPLVQAKAIQIGEVVQRGPFTQVHAMIGAAMMELGGKAGWRFRDGAEARLKANPTADPYAFTLVGRGLGHAVGAIGPVDRKGAERDLGRAVFIDPNLAVAQRLIGELLTGDLIDPRAPVRAAGKFSYAVDLKPDYVPALRAAAGIASMAGKHDTARDLYRRLVTLRPWDLDTRFRLGDAMWKTGDGDGALRELGRVVRQEPGNLSARRVMVLIHASRGDTQNLVTQLEEVVRGDPADLEARADLGAAYATTGRWKDATDAWEMVATARPNDATAQKRVGDAWRRRGDPARAEEWYGRASRIAPDDPRPSYLIGAAWLDASARGGGGDALEAAHRAFIRAQRNRYYLGYSYTALGTIAFLRQDLDTAVWYLRRAAKLRPRSRDARYDYVLMLALRSEWDGALLQVNLALGYWPKDADLLYLRGVALARKGDAATARRALGQAIAADPGHGPARRAASALDRDGAIRVEGQPIIEHPFGDGDHFRAVIDRFGRAQERMAELRSQLDGVVFGILAGLGEGPGKDLKAARLRARTCPLLRVAQPWAEARRLLEAFERAGADLEVEYRTIADLEPLGEAAALSPAYRARLPQVRDGWRLAQADLRELRNAVYVQIQGELQMRRCSDALLAAALAQPRLYGSPEEARRDVPAATPAPVVRKEPAHATFYVDNRECPDPVVVSIDGELVGEVPAGERSALSALVGRRTMCLIVGTAAASCGDRGTVRQAYLHDGWEVAMRCPRAPARVRRAGAPLPASGKL